MFSLAEALHQPVHLLLKGMPQSELCHWMSYYKLKNEKDGDGTTERPSRPATSKEQADRDAGWLGLLITSSVEN